MPAPVGLGSGVVQVRILVEGLRVSPGGSRRDRERAEVIEAARVLVPGGRTVLRREAKDFGSMGGVPDFVEETERQFVDGAIRHRRVPEYVDLVIKVPALVVVFFTGIIRFSVAERSEDTGVSVERRGSGVLAPVALLVHVIRDRGADVLFDDAVKPADFAIADAGAGGQKRRRAGRRFDLVGVSQRLADVDALGFAVADALSVFNEGTDVNVGREADVGDGGEFDGDPMPPVGSRDLFPVRRDGTVNRGRGGVVFLRSIGFRGLRVARREDEPDRVVRKRTDRKEESQIGARAVFYVGADHRLVTEVLYLTLRRRIRRRDRRQERRHQGEQRRKEKKQGYYSPLGDTVFHFVVLLYVVYLRLARRCLARVPWLSFSIHLIVVFQIFSGCALVQQIRVMRAGDRGSLGSDYGFENFCLS